MDMQSIKREEAKQAYLAERRRKEEKKRLTKEKAETRWRRKMENSPFLVDLVADHERIDEENRMRLKEEARRERLLNKRKEKIKNEIILKALAESTDLEALREEKRAIAMEEKRLKALIDLEKAKLKKKASHQVGLFPFPLLH
ncbi:unnamed protein product [Symbiodinium sp. KB8]|nr:unnamed protein product [Symbiodinium sp. KB8]